TIARLDLARAFALRSQPSLLAKLAPPALRDVAKSWASKVGQRKVEPGLLASVLAELAARDGIKLGSDASSRSIVKTSVHTPLENKLDTWFRSEARLALGVLAVLQPMHVKDIDASISGDDR